MSIAEKFEVIADEIYEKGKKDEYDKFWDSFQNGGKRTNYIYCFFGWSDENFYPKYDIAPTGQGNNMFFLCEIKGDLGQRFSECGIEFDTSKMTVFGGMFQACYYLTAVPVLDFQGANSNSLLDNIFYNCSSLITASLINIRADLRFSNAFLNCNSLKNLTIEGTIGQNGFNVQWSKKLTKDSLLSILKALSLNITETKTITFSTAHQSIIETDSDCKPYWEAAKNAGWSFVYA